MEGDPDPYLVHEEHIEPPGPEKADYHNAERFPQIPSSLPSSRWCVLENNDLMDGLGNRYKANSPSFAGSLV